MWKTHAFAKPSPTRKRNARVRRRDREDAIAPCVGAMTDRTHIFLRVRVTRKPLGSFETSRRRSKKPRASTPRLARRRQTEPEAHPNPPAPRRATEDFWRRCDRTLILIHLALTPRIRPSRSSSSLARSPGAPRGVRVARLRATEVRRAATVRDGRNRSKTIDARA